MPLFSRTTIEGRLTWMNMMVSGAALLLASVVLFAYDFVTFRRTIVQDLSTEAQLIGSNSASALTFDDPQAAADTLSALRAAPNVTMAAVYAVDGSPFATYWRDRTADTPDLPKFKAGQTQIESLGDGRVVIARRIVFQGSPLGSVYIESDLSQEYDRLERDGVIVGLVLAASLVTALLLSRRSQKAISGPIARLAETARDVSQHKNYSLRASAAGHQAEMRELVDSFNEMLAQIQERDRALQRGRDELEKRVEERTQELETANKELESFCYSVSHDLRAPLRGIDGFSQALLEDYGHQLDAVGQDYLQRVRAAAQRMALLIDDLLTLSRISRAELQRKPIDLTQLALSVAADLRRANPDRPVEFAITAGMRATVDPELIRTVFENLIGNAWKFSSKREDARIEVGETQTREGPTFFVRDNGAGFDQAYAGRLFGAFQRLHTMAEFPGTGVGLASVHRAIRRHGGSIWAEGRVDHGATFYFVLPDGLSTAMEGRSNGEQHDLVGGRQSR